MTTKWFQREKQQRQKCIDYGTSIGCKFFVSRTTLCGYCEQDNCFRHKNKTAHHMERGYKDYNEYLETDFNVNGHDFEIIQGPSRLLIDLDLPWSDNENILHRTIDLVLNKLRRNSIA